MGYGKIASVNELEVEGTRMIADDKLVELDEMMAETLSEKGFRRKKKMFYSRVQGDSVQSIILMSTKVRGRDQYSIDAYYGIAYENIVKMVQYLQGRKHEANERVVQNALTNLIKGPKPYVFYIDESSDNGVIIADLMEKIETFVEPIWRENTSIEEFVGHLKDQTRVLGFPETEWILLSMELLNNSGSHGEVIRQNQALFDRPRNKRFMEGLESRIQKYLGGEIRL